MDSHWARGRAGRLSVLEPIEMLLSEITALRMLPPIERALAAAELQHTASTLLAAVKRHAIVEATSSRQIPEVAAQLDLSPADITSAISRHRSGHRED